jgi:hypothetical protein
MRGRKKFRRRGEAKHGDERWRRVGEGLVSNRTAIAGIAGANCRIVYVDWVGIGDGASKVRESSGKVGEGLRVRRFIRERGGEVKEGIRRCAFSVANAASDHKKESVRSEGGDDEERGEILI